MAVKKKDVILLLRAIYNADDVGDTVKGKLKAVAIIAGFVTAGSLLLGPIGLLVGGVLGGAFGYISQKSKYDPLIKVFRKMPEAKKDKLKSRVDKTWKGVDAKDLSIFAEYFVYYPSAVKLLLDIVSSGMRDAESAEGASDTEKDDYEDEGMCWQIWKSLAEEHKKKERSSWDERLAAVFDESEYSKQKTWEENYKFLKKASRGRIEQQRRLQVPRSSLVVMLS